MSKAEAKHSESPHQHHRWPRWALAAATAAGLALWLWGDGGCDDANISFRYAYHMAHGYGSVWNPGDTPSMGSSTPLWLMLLTLVERLWSGHIPVAANLAAAVSWGLLTAVVWATGEHLRWRRPWVAAGVLAGMAPLAAARMRGMETATYALLIAVTYLAWLREPRAWKWGVWAGLCALIRLDGWLVLTVLALATAVTRRRVPLAAVATAVAMYLPWLAWQWWATGALVPQALHAKALWREWVRFNPLGLPYLTAPPVVGIALWAVLAVGALWGLRERRLWPVVVWGVVYCVAYRAAKLPHMGWYYIPLLLPIALLAETGIDRSRFARGGSAAAVGLAAAAGLMLVAAGHPWTPWRFVYPPVTPAQAYEQHGVTRIAHWLREHDPGATVLTFECGIIGYVSGCHVIDSLGLVSREAWPYLSDADFAAMVRHLRPDYIAWRASQREAPRAWAPGYQRQHAWLDDMGWYNLYRYCGSDESAYGAVEGADAPAEARAAEARTRR